MMANLATLARAGEYAVVAVELERLPDGPDKQQLISALLSLAFICGKDSAVRDMRESLLVA